jgi:mono/diheme cytochrome c family protein
MVQTNKVIVLAAMLVAAPTIAARAQTDADVARGKAIAEQACAGCHAMDNWQGGSIQGTPAPAFRAIAGKARTERLKDLVTTPPHPMPGIPLSASEVNALVAYIRSLK